MRENEVKATLLYACLPSKFNLSWHAVQEVNVELGHRMGKEESSQKHKKATESLN